MTSVMFFIISAVHFSVLTQDSVHVLLLFYINTHTGSLIIGWANVGNLAALNTFGNWDADDSSLVQTGGAGFCVGWVEGHRQGRDNGEDNHGGSGDDGKGTHLTLCICVCV